MWLFYRNDDGVFPSPSRLGFHEMTCYKNNEQQHILKYSEFRKDHLIVEYPLSFRSLRS